MYLTVREAALRLGVSSVTIRRWTASGVLPCTRTPGGHRRISTTDIDDLARLITEGDLVGARLAREREIDTMISTAVAMTSRLEIADLLAEIARQATSIFACTYCIVFELDQAAQALRLLAEYDSSGSHVSLRGESGSLVYDLAGFTLVRKVLEDRTIGIVDVDDPLADPAERQILMDDGDASLAMVPMVYKDESIGTIELIDARPRSYTPQEQRLMRSMAALAAVALVNARAYESRGWAVGPANLSHLPLHDLAGSFPAALSEPDLPSLLNGIAGSICSSFRAVSCVVSLGFNRAAVTGATVVRAGQTPVILEGRDRSGASDLTVSVTLPVPAHPFMNEILDLVAGAASALVVRVQTGEEPPVS